KTGQSVRLDGPVVQPIELNSAAFRTAKDLVARSADATRTRHQEWLEDRAALRKDPSLLVHYSFAAEHLWSRTLLDQVGGGSEPHDGVIVGCSWVTGRWPGIQGLEFKRVSDRVRFRVPGEFDPATLAAWVRVDALPNRTNSL